MSRRVYNFGPGPAMLPEAVMRRAQEELLDWNGSGKSVMEIGHRTPEFIELVDHIDKTLREIMAIPSSYHVLFLAGGATHQYSVIPMNLLRGKGSADYINTGIWSAKAIRAAERYAKINVVCSSADDHYQSIPDVDTWQQNADAAYCYYTDNETIGGVEFHSLPVSTTPLISDMTSSILSKQVNVNDFGLIFASAQKNVGPAGLTLVIVNAALLDEVLPETPDLLNYRLQAKYQSMLNTPPTFNWYMAGLVFDWIKQQGGVAAMEQLAIRKSAMLYDYIDSSSLFVNRIEASYRSRMNVVFYLRQENKLSHFLKQAQANGLHALKGHKLVGGCRASLYNSMPVSGVENLVSFMREYERAQG